MAHDGDPGRRNGRTRRWGRRVDGTAADASGTPGTEPLAEELRQLGRDGPAEQDALVRAVMLRVEREPVPVAVAVGAAGTVRTALARTWRWCVLRWRAVLAGLAGLLLVAVLAPPVRATVADWLGFDFGGVAVRQDPAPRPPGKPDPQPPRPSSAGPHRGLSLQQARKLLTFEPVLPRKLGRPVAVEVSADRRVLSLTWEGTRERPGRIRVDEFDGRLDPAFAKSVAGPAEVRFAEVHGGLALWFPKPHRLELLQRDGGPDGPSTRLAGRTLVWERGAVTLRLEGAGSPARALDLAESAKPSGTRGAGAV